MTAVTTYDVNRVITGEKIEITSKYPLKDRPDGFRWFIMQPTDWLYDMALAVAEAAEAEVLAQPEMETMRTLPPSKEWLHQQTLSRRRTESRIKEIEGKKKATPEEELELLGLKDYLGRLIDPANFNRADEIAAQTANRARDMWLLPRLLIDEQGALLCDLTSTEGQARWSNFGRRVRMELRGFLAQALVLVMIAKNSEAGLSSS